MILVLGQDSDIHVQWIRETLQRPVITAHRIEAIRNLLPIASMVFVNENTKAWSDLDVGPATAPVYMLVNEKDVHAQTFVRAMKDAPVRDSFLVGNDTEATRLLEFVDGSLINEIPG